MTCVIREASIYCTGCLLAFNVADAPPPEHLEGDPVEWTLLALEGHQDECSVDPANSVDFGAAIWFWRCLSCGTIIYSRNAAAPACR